jgi:hypothetical protein
MTERPILFSAPMVRALLDGTKTQTRRELKRQPWASCSIEEGNAGESPFVYSALHGPGPGHDVEESRTPCRCPYGQPGDRLWVRETWAQPAALDPGPTVYRADYPACVSAQYENVPSAEEITWKPSIHMFRKDSRILLEITGVRVERLQDISEVDADAEGCERLEYERYERDPALCPKCDGLRLHRELGPGGGVIEDVDCIECDTYVKRYRHLWESINGAGSWDANPWVWVVEFRRVER